MSHYKSNLRDLEFNLFEAYGVDEYLGVAPFEDIDHDTAMDMLREVDRLATEDFAETFAVWLTPRARWRKLYREWPALRKLEFVDRLDPGRRDLVELIELGHSRDVSVDAQDATAGHTGIELPEAFALIDGEPTVQVHFAC